MTNLELGRAMAEAGKLIWERGGRPLTEWEKRMRVTRTDVWVHAFGGAYRLALTAPSIRELEVTMALPTTFSGLPVEGQANSGGKVTLEGVATNGLFALEDGLSSVISGTESLGDAFSNMSKRILADLARIAIQRAILGALGGSGADGARGGIGGFFSSLFGGGRATGGPVSAGKTYLVGERGPELLTMGGQSGFVTPNNQLGSSMAALAAVNATAARSAPPAAMPPIVIKIASRKGDAFEAEVLSVTGPQTVQILREAAPQLMDAATVRTVAELRKQNMRL